MQQHCRYFLGFNLDYFCWCFVLLIWQAEQEMSLPDKPWRSGALNSNPTLTKMWQSLKTYTIIVMVIIYYYSLCIYNSCKRLQLHRHFDIRNMRRCVGCLQYYHHAGALQAEASRGSWIHIGSRCAGWCDVMWLICLMKDKHAMLLSYLCDWAVLLQKLDQLQLFCPSRLHFFCGPPYGMHPCSQIGIASIKWIGKP